MGSARQVPNQTGLTQRRTAWISVRPCGHSYGHLKATSDSLYCLQLIMVLTEKICVLITCAMFTFTVEFYENYFEKFMFSACFI